MEKLVGKVTNHFNIDSSKSHQQVIAPEWQTELQQRLNWAEEARTIAYEGAFGSEFDLLWGEYNCRCREVVSFIDEQHGGVENLIEIMKGELRRKAAPFSISLEGKLEWHGESHSMPKGQESIGVVEALGSTLKYPYLEASQHIDRAIKAITESQFRLRNDWV